jgi:Mitochondrial ribosomal subunit protein
MALCRSFSKFQHLLPVWNQRIYRDPFDYPLRSLEEVKAELEKNPIDKTVGIEIIHHKDGDGVPGELDLRQSVAKMYVNMDSWNLTKKQKERLIFLLGPRYQNKPEFKIVSRQYPLRDQNIQKCMDIIYELLMESKRAP